MEKAAITSVAAPKADINLIPPKKLSEKFSPQKKKPLKKQSFSTILKSKLKSQVSWQDAVMASGGAVRNSETSVEKKENSSTNADIQ